METNKVFQQVISKFPAVSSLKTIKDVEGLQLIAWQNKHLYFCNLTNDQVSNLFGPLKHHSSYEEVISEEDIVDVFSFENQLFVVDQQCYINEILQEDIQDVEWEGDLFDDTPKKLVKSHMKRKHQISQDSKLLAACVLPDGIACLLNTPTSIIVKIINPKTLCEVNCFTVRNSTLTIRSQHTVCLMLFVSKDEVESTYVKNWFPEVNLENSESDLLIISLPECIICGVFLDKKPSIPHFIFSWPFQAVYARWLCIQDEDPNRISRKSNLIIAFDGGAVVILGQYGGKIAYFPLKYVRSAYINMNYIFATDYSDCYSLKIFENEEIFRLPVQGVLGFSSVPGQDHIILATTKHRTLYAINSKERILRPDIFKLPNVRMFDEFLNKINYLEQLTKKIVEQEQYINALSYSLNSSVLEFCVTVESALIAGYTHSFRIKIQNKNPGIIFRKNTWKLFISLHSTDSCYTCVRNLEFDLTTDTPLIDYFTIDCLRNVWDFSVDTNLVCLLRRDKYLPTVNIGKVFLDITYFIQPISSLKMHFSIIERDVDIMKILENISSRFHSQQLNKKTNEKDNTLRFCTIEVPIDEMHSTELVVKLLLRNSRPLWRTNEWNEICKKDSFQVFISGETVKIEVRKGLIIIIGKELEMCNSLKIASVKLLNPNFKLNINDNLKKKVADLRTALECIEYTSDEIISDSQNKILELFKEFRENVVFPLTGIKMYFSSGTNDLIKDKETVADP